MNGFSYDDLYTKPVTFMAAPYSLDLSGAKVAVLGVPFDCGVHPFRVGSRQGPTAIREQSKLVRRYNPELADFDPLERLALLDLGDVRLTPSRINDAFERIEAAAKRIHDLPELELDQKQPQRARRYPGHDGRRR
jgi:agmatinase